MMYGKANGYGLLIGLIRSLRKKVSIYFRDTPSIIAAFGLVTIEFIKEAMCSTSDLTRKRFFPSQALSYFK
jgi:hypothetical protein